MKKPISAIRYISILLVTSLFTTICMIDLAMSATIDRKNENLKIPLSKMSSASQEINIPDVTLRVNTPKKVGPNEEFNLSVYIMENENIKFGKDILKIDVPNGFISINPNPFPDTKGAYNYKMTSSTLPGNNKIIINVNYPNNFFGTVEYNLEVTDKRDSNIAHAELILPVHYKSIIAEKNNGAKFVQNIIRGALGYILFMAVFAWFLKSA
ncbi:hypothetical protein ACFL52_00740 [Candidatus Margulisiibacteriota bacterium]